MAVIVLDKHHLSAVFEFQSIAVGIAFLVKVARNLAFIKHTRRVDLCKFCIVDVICPSVVAA